MNLKCNKQGFTYVEMIICLCIATVIVGPITEVFLTSMKTRVSATYIDEATNLAEELMLEIEEKTGQWSSSTNKEKVSNIKDRGKIEKLETILGEEESAIEQRYCTQKYAYEIAIWQMDLVTLSKDDTFTLNSQTLHEANKIYTDTQYQFKPTDYEDMSQPITFQIMDEMQEEKRGDLNRITFKEDNSLDQIKASDTTSKAKVSLSSLIQEDGEIKGYHFKIENNNLQEKTLYTEEETGIIELDVRNLTRGYTFKFTNQTNNNQMIRIKQKSVSSEMQQNFNIIVEEQGLGKSTIVYIGDEKEVQDYMMVIIVRDKKPIQGKEGKIIKKMLDFYSYSG